MQVHIADHVYRINNVNGRMYYEGKQCLILCDHEANEIRVSSLVPKVHREALIAQAVSDAWSFRTSSWRRAVPVRELTLA